MTEEETQEMATITSSADIAGKDDQIVRVVGVYGTEDLGRYRIKSVLADGTELQSNILSFVELDDGGYVRLGARPEDEHALASKRVVATGKLKEKWPPPDPRAAQPNAKPTLLEITSVTPE